MREDVRVIGWRCSLVVLLAVGAITACTSGSAPDGPAASTPVTTAVSSAADSSTAVSSAADSSAADSSAADSSAADSSSVASAPSTATQPVVTPTPPPKPSSSTAPPIPPLSAKARADGLVDIRTIIPDAIVDLRYATSDNFVGVRLYPRDARCLVYDSMVAGLKSAAEALRRKHDVLVFWDCYRPHAVQVHMFQVVPNPNWVARPGPYATSHEAARSVDVTLAHAGTTRPCPSDERVQRHCLLDMGTGFDDFTPRAYAFATYDVSATAQSNRARLRTAMNTGGITVYQGEWWHFDGPGALVERPILDAPLS